MTPERIIAIALVAAVAVATLRLLLGTRRSPAAARPRTWRVVAILVLQAAAAGLLYLTLLPPSLPAASGTLVVATAGATRAQLDAAAGDRVVSLPEAGEVAGADAVPDLATALRRHPRTARLHIVGAGLEARDRDAVDGRAVAFSAAPPPRGIVAVSAPDAVAPGQRFVVHGRVAGVDDARIALLDPAGRRVAVGTPDAAGRFALDATARIAGTALYALQLGDGVDAIVERLPVPVWTLAQTPPRVLLLAAAPNPETKYLRRWADDAGLSTRLRIELGGGARVADPGTSLDRAALAALDLVVSDARAFASLGPAQRAALREAVQGGLGVLVHAPGGMPDALRPQLRAFGLDVAAETNARPLQFAADTRDVAVLRARLGGGSDDAPFDATLATEALPTLAYRPLRGDAAAFDGLRGPDDLALWQALGRGRIGVTAIEDSWQLATAGRGDVHAELWSGWFSTLARAGDAAAVDVRGERRVGQRLVLCGLGADDRVVAPDGGPAQLQVDPRAGEGDCAGFWPRLAGWHRVIADDGVERPFHVASPDVGIALHAAALRDATVALVRESGTAASGDMRAAQPRRGASWPWFAAWLAVVAGLWALERSTLGRGDGKGSVASRGGRSSHPG
ncbi:carboxypeptidase regulatory-like domain-containing protein [Luteimonas sp. BDR2-5]|uniref:carboxypeptidase regulatory-like domain-containing protein n=1 Tax=Proluteimonas luteida TaxID=2878685 RepID=UPI001E6425F4|nr:carboxypeptidase regulatory-like domain-containing protein [Luteimonas sp. BDR2-5]MCD9029233.1 carboxypeptidase regulatory-like domain-containing protein [Luteimonas sp. BDR2-5]